MTVTALGTRTTTLVGGVLLAVGLLAGCGSGSGTGSGSGSSGSGGSGPGSPTPPPGQAQRLLELSSVGGFAGPTATALRPPALVVYSDGTVVLDGARVAKVSADQARQLTATVGRDLAGQPADLVGKHPMPDVPSTVLGVRQAGGSYQKLTATGLAQVRAGGDSGFPAPVLDAYQQIAAFQKAADSGSTTPYTSQKVRLDYQCTGSADGKPWPSGLPQPAGQESPAGAPSCVEIQAVSGTAAQVAKTACAEYGGAQQPTVYLSDHGPRACQWRYDLPDE